MKVCAFAWCCNVVFFLYLDSVFDHLEKQHSMDTSHYKLSDKDFKYVGFTLLLL